MPSSPETRGYAERPWLSAYPDGVPDEIGDVSGTLVDLIEDAIRAFPTHVALRFFDRTITYRTLGRLIDGAAEALRRKGVVAGDRVALILPNCPQHVVAFYAAVRLGAVVVEHNPLYTAAELEQHFIDHGSQLAVVWDKAAPAVAELPEPVRPATILTVDLTRGLPWYSRLLLRMPLKAARTARAELSTTAVTAAEHRFDRLIMGPPLDPAHPRPAVDSIAVLQYTSGTTGAPKGAVLTHANLVANAAQGRAWVPGLRAGRETVYAVLPLFHAYGLTLCMTYAMSIGAQLVLFPRFDVDRVLDAMKRAPATFLPAVPPIYDRLLIGAVRRKVSLTSIRYSISGAMSLPPATVKTWEEFTGGLLVEGYGLTETSPVALGNPMGPARRPGTVGVPFPGTEIRVVDPGDPTIDRPVGDAGELLIRGPQVFSGYWNRPDETAAALLPGGWFRSGDIVTMSADGFVTVVDRIKELIIVGGFNVAPSQVEEQLLAHPDVDAAAVIGVPSPSGEEVVAAVVLRDGAAFDPEALRAFCRARLTPYKVPKRIVRVSELPRSLIGKVLRRQVRAEIMSGAGQSV